MGDTGKLDELKGRFEKAGGELTNDPSLKQRGTVDKISGNVKQGVEHAKEKVRDLIDRDKNKE